MIRIVSLVVTYLVPVVGSLPRAKNCSPALNFCTSVLTGAALSSPTTIKKRDTPKEHPVFWNILRNLIQCNAVVLSVAFVKQLKIEKTETYKHINNSVLCYGKQLDLMSINFCNRSNRCAKSSFVKWKEAFQFFQSSI